MRVFSVYRLRTLILGLIATAVFATLPLWAHAILIESTPAAHGSVQGPNVTIHLRFNSRIDGAHSRIYVNTTAGPKQIKIDSQSTPDALSGTASDLKPGEYQLRWQVLAVRRPHHARRSAFHGSVTHRSWRKSWIYTAFSRSCCGV